MLTRVILTLFKYSKKLRLKKYYNGHCHQIKDGKLLYLNISLVFCCFTDNIIYCHKESIGRITSKTDLHQLINNPNKKSSGKTLEILMFWLLSIEFSVV